MKTISPHINTNHHNSYKNNDHIAGDMNRNASISQAEYQRDACEEELYRLRYGIEQLLANAEQGDSRNRYRPRNDFVQNSYRTEMNDLINRKNRSWFERCTPCCRRWRRTRYDDCQQYSPHPQDSFVSRSPPIFSPVYKSHPKNDRRRNVDNLFSQTTPDNKKISNLLASKDIDDPVYQSLILKILETKALDCLCADYSKQNTQRQISQTFTDLNQKTRDNQWDSTSVTSSTLSPTSSYDSSSSSPSVSVSSNISNDESILSSRSITPHSYSPSPISIQTPSRSQITPLPFASPTKSTASSILNDGNDSSKTKPKVAIIEDKKPSPSKSKTEKKASSKRSKKPSKSKSSKKKPSKSKSSKKKSSKRKSSKKKPTSSKTKSKKPSSKSRSKKSKHKKKSKKPKSNNQVYDHESKIIYCSPYKKASENRQSYLHNFFDPVFPVSFNGNRRI